MFKNWFGLGSKEEKSREDNAELTLEKALQLSRENLRQVPLPVLIKLAAEAKEEINPLTAESIDSNISEQLNKLLSTDRDLVDALFVLKKKGLWGSNTKLQQLLATLMIEYYVRTIRGSDLVRQLTRKLEDFYQSK